MKWDKVKLGLVVRNLDSRRKPLNEQERSRIANKGLYPYIGANNIMGYVDEYLFDETILCVAEDGGSWGLGQICATIYNGKTWVNNHAHVLSASDKIDLRYLKYFLNHTDLSKHISGSTRGKLTKSSLESIEVPLPPLLIQEQIADTLDKADALRKKDQELLKKYDELSQSIFYDMFGDPVKNEMGWDISMLGNLVINCNNRRVPVKGEERSNLAKIYPYYGASGIIDHIDRYIFEGKHLLIGEDGANLLSRSTPIAFLAEGQFWVNNHAHVMKQKSIPLEFIETVVNCIDLKPYVTGSAQPKLTREKLDNIPIITPPATIVAKFDVALSVLRSSRSQLLRNLKMSDSLFQTNISFVFS